MYLLRIFYTDDPTITYSERARRTFAISEQLVDYEAYGCCANDNVIMFDCDEQRTIAQLVIGDYPNISRLRLG